MILGFEAFYAFGLVFMLCELCQRVSNAFTDINDVLEALDWYLLPAEVKQLLPIIIQFSQQPIVFEYFGTFSCDREAFKKVSTSKIDIFSLQIKILRN